MTEGKVVFIFRPLIFVVLPRNLKCEVYLYHCFLILIVLGSIFNDRFLVEKYILTVASINDHISPGS